MVKPMGEKYTSNFMKNHYNILYTNDLNVKKIIKRVDEVIDDAKKEIIEKKLRNIKKVYRKMN